MLRRCQAGRHRPVSKGPRRTMPRPRPARAPRWPALAECPCGSSETRGGTRDESFGILGPGDAMDSARNLSVRSSLSGGHRLVADTQELKSRVIQGTWRSGRPSQASPISEAQCRALLRRSERRGQCGGELAEHVHERHVRACPHHQIEGELKNPGTRLWMSSITRPKTWKSGERG